MEKMLPTTKQAAHLTLVLLMRRRGVNSLIGQYGVDVQPEEIAISETITPLYRTG